MSTCDLNVGCQHVNECCKWVSCEHDYKLLVDINLHIGDRSMTPYFKWNASLVLHHGIKLRKLRSCPRKGYYNDFLLNKRIS